MKSFLKFVLVFSGILLLSAFLAPLLFKVLPYKFERIFNRLVMILSLAAIVLFVRVRKEDLRHTGLLGRPDSFHAFMTTFISGFTVLTVLMAIKMGVGQTMFALQHLTPLAWIQRIVTSLGAALLIAFIEETFFRGFVYGRLKNTFKGAIVPAVVLTSIFYSSVHFVHGKKPFIGPDPGFMDSLHLIAAPFNSFASWQTFWTEAAGLFIFGLVLNAVYIRTTTLYAPMGLHAGCVFFVKLDGLFADSLNNNNLFWGSSKMYDGAMGWLFLAALGILLTGKRGLMKRHYNMKAAALVMAFTFCLAPAVTAAELEREEVPVASSDAIYIIPEHLQEANAEIFFANKESRKGIWEQEQFQFYGMDDGARIKIVSGNAGEGDSEVSWQAIDMVSIPRSYRKLQFLNVPPGANLNISYRTEVPEELQKSEKKTKQNIYIYFNVFAGKKIIRQIRISVQEKGWHQVVVPLKVLGLLNRNFPLSFSLTGSDQLRVPFRFFAEVTQ